MPRQVVRKLRSGQMSLIPVCHNTTTPAATSTTPSAPPFLPSSLPPFLPSSLPPTTSLMPVLIRLLKVQRSHELFVSVSCPSEPDFGPVRDAEADAHFAPVIGDERISSLVR